MKILRVGDEMFLRINRQTDKHIDMMKLISAFRRFCERTK